MSKMAMMKLAASVLVLGTATVGCSMSGQASRPAALSDAKIAKLAADAAANARRALAAKRGDKAVGYAEAAVAARPNDADYRMLLGQSYLAAGRFQSAETSFADTLKLDPNRERAALNMALAQIALGRNDAARSTLGEYREKLSAADFGLATALAGDVREAVRVLEIAARAPGADAKTRQNLALAYALDNQWANARSLASQDLPQGEADQRMVQWASFTKPTGSWDQVASLLGVRPAADTGQPSQLALAAPASATEVASAEVAPPADAVAVAPAPVPTEVAQVEPTPVANDPVAPAFETAAVPAAPVAAPVAASKSRFVPVIKASPTQYKRAAFVTPAIVSTMATSRKGETGRFVVQLGAFSNAAVAERAWGSATGRFSLASYDPVKGTARLRKGNLVRLSIAGFNARGDADRLCGKIRSSGGKCFVRAAQGDAPALWAQRAKPTRVASR